MRGYIEVLKPNYGFLMGEDNVSRFFIPTCLKATTLPWELLRVGMGVQFTSIAHPRGPRAIEVRITDERDVRVGGVAPPLVPRRSRGGNKD